MGSSSAGLLTATSLVTEAAAHQQAQLLVVRFGALVGVAGLLLELRAARQLREATTGVFRLRTASCSATRLSTAFSSPV